MIKAYSLAPGANGYLQLNLPANWKNNDALLLTVTDVAGNEIVSRSWPIAGTQTVAAKYTNSTSNAVSSLKEENNQLIVTNDGITYYFSTETGQLQKVKGTAGDISLSDGPVLAGVKTQLK